MAMPGRSARERGRAWFVTMVGRRRWRGSTGFSMPPRRHGLLRRAVRLSPASPFPREQLMSVQTPKIDRPIAVPATLRVWIPALFWIGAACAAFGFAFQHEIGGAVRVWNNSTAYNHCYLVLPLVGVLLWMRRDLFAQLRPAPSWWPLVLLPVVSALWLAAALLDVLEAAQLSVVLLFEILLLAVLGWQVFRALLAPLLFLFFLVPFGAFIVPLLQTFTAAFTVEGLELLGIPVFADGYIIQIPAGTFEVAEACAGLRFLIASIVFGCFFATVVYRGKWRRSAFIALSIVVPIVANGFRALGLVVLANVMGSATSAMADHVLYGWLFFTIVTLLLIAIGMTFREDARPTPPRTTPAERAAAAVASWAGDGHRLAARTRRTGISLPRGARFGRTSCWQTVLPSRAEMVPDS